MSICSEQLPLVTRSEPCVGAAEPGFEERILAEQLQRAESVAIDAGFEVRFQFCKCAASGVSSMAEEPRVDTRGKGQAGQKWIECRGGKVVSVEVSQKIRGLFRIGAAKKFGFVVTHQRNDAAAIVYSFFLQRLDEAENIHRAGAFVDHVTVENEDGLAGNPVNVGVDDLGGLKETDKASVIAVNVADSENG